MHGISLADFITEGSYKRLYIANTNFIRYQYHYWRTTRLLFTMHHEYSRMSNKNGMFIIFEENNINFKVLLIENFKIKDFKIYYEGELIK